MLQIDAGKKNAMNESKSRLLMGLAVAVVAPLLALVGGCARSGPTLATQASAKSASTQAVPPAAADALAVNGSVLLTVHAHGYQIYSRVAADTWKLKAPDAEFSSDDGVKGKHYAGPTWETADGSKVVAVKIAERPSPEPDAVPWLLLRVVSHEGNGPIGAATFVKRINTTGGKLPEERPKEDNEIHVPYTADYIFYGPGATTGP